MKLLSNRRTRRRCVVAVLAAWLFSLSAGWVHACLLKERGAHFDGHAVGAVAQAPLVSAGHAGLDSAHDDSAGAADKACLKFCDDETQTIVKLTPGLDPTDAAMAPPVATLWTAHAATPTAALSMAGAGPPGAGLPLRTRYSRLAL